MEVASDNFVFVNLRGVWEDDDWFYGGVSSYGESYVHERGSLLW